MSDYYFEGYDKGYRDGSEEKYDELREQVIMICATADTPLDLIRQIQDFFNLCS